MRHHGFTAETVIPCRSAHVGDLPAQKDFPPDLAYLIDHRRAHDTPRGRHIEQAYRIVTVAEITEPCVRSGDHIVICAIA